MAYYGSVIQKESKTFSADIDRDHGWQRLNDAGFADPDGFN
jgi:hypothetical protein